MKRNPTASHALVGLKVGVFAVVCVSSCSLAHAQGGRYDTQERPNAWYDRPIGASDSSRSNRTQYARDWYASPRAISYGTPSDVPGNYFEPSRFTFRRLGSGFSLSFYDLRAELPRDGYTDYAENRIAVAIPVMVPAGTTIYGFDATYEGSIHKDTATVADVEVALVPNKRPSYFFKGSRETHRGRFVRTTNISEWVRGGSLGETVYIDLVVRVRVKRTSDTFAAARAELSRIAIVPRLRP